MHTDLYSIRDKVTMMDLQQRAEELLVSVAMMIDVLNENGGKKITVVQQTLLGMMQDLVRKMLNLFSCLYGINSPAEYPPRKIDAVFQFNQSANKDQLQKSLLDGTYQLNAINQLVTTEMLDSFDDTRGNILLSSVQRTQSLVEIIELLCAAPTQVKTRQVQVSELH